MRKILLILLVSICTTAHAQVYDSISRSSIKVDLLNLADEFPTVMVSYEHKLKNTIYLHHEAGVILPVTNYNYDDVSGFKLREEIRNYIVSWGINDLYMGIDFRYTQERIHENITLGYQCISDWWWTDCQFYKNEPGVYKKERFAFGYRIGLRHTVYPFYFEYDTGLSYGKDYISNPDVEVPEGFELLSSDPFNIWNHNWKVLPTVRAKFGMHLTKKKPH